MTGWPSKALTNSISEFKEHAVMHPVVTKTSALVRAGDLASAERALTAIAEDEGDHALISVLDQVPPKDLLAIMREYDSSKESMINLAVTPEQFARAVVHNAQYGDRNHDQLRGMMNAVLYRDPEQTANFLRALGKQANGIDVLTNYFSEREDELFEFATTGNFGGGIYGRPEPEDINEGYDQTAAFDFFDNSETPKVTRAEISDNDWMETAWVLRYEKPYIFERLLHAFKLKQKAALEAFKSARDHRETKVGDTVTDEESAL
jgi:hypothetical protein